jgi:uncharacterized peroxidase-related enzyme
MSRTSPLAESDMCHQSKPLIYEIRHTLGRVPNMFLAYAHYPPLLRANWNKVQAVMMEGCLSRKLKEIIACLVSQDNDCAYCLTAHQAALRRCGVEQSEFVRLTENVDSTVFSAKERALIQLARRANLAPHDISDADFDRVRDTGASDAEIVEALGVMELFVGLNRFVDSLQVDLDREDEVARQV